MIVPAAVPMTSVANKVLQTTNPSMGSDCQIEATMVINAPQTIPIIRPAPNSRKIRRMALLRFFPLDTIPRTTTTSDWVPVFPVLPAIIGIK